MSSNDLSTAIEAEIRGNVSGQVAVGTHIIQIGSVHGGVVNVAGPAERVVPRPRTAPVFLRPQPFPRLVGRAREVDAAAAALRSARPVELSGPPGAGKTALLRHLAHHAASESFQGGVVFLPALRQPVNDLLQLLFDALFEADAPLKPSYPELCRLLGSWQALVVLDDVGLEREEVERVLNAAPGCTFLWAAPARQAWGEVRGLPLAGLEADDVRALLEGELERGLSADELAGLPALREATGGFPLPLLQAAARVRDGVPLAVLAGSPPEGTVAERSAATGLGAEADGLSAPQRELVLLLAAVDGALVHPRHAAALSGIPNAGQELDALERRGLALRQGERYRLRERAVASAPEEAAWRARALAYFTGWVEQRWSEPAGIVAEKDVLMSLLAGAANAQAWLDVLRLGRPMEGALAVAGHWDAWRQVVEWLRRAAEATEDRRGAAWALHQLGSMDLCLGNRAAAQTALEAALRLREVLGDREGARITQHNLNLLLPPPAGRGRNAQGAATRVGRKGVAALVAAVGAIALLSPPHRAGHAPSPTVVFDPASVDFGKQAVGAASTARVLRLTNRGEDGLRIGGVAAAGGGFSVSGGDCSGPAGLQAGRECSILVRFTPLAAGSSVGRVSVTDAAGRPLYDAALSGVGVAPPPAPTPARPHEPAAPVAAPALVRPSLAAVDFGPQKLRAPAAYRTIRLSNAGGRPVRITHVRVAGSGAGFTADGCAGAVVRPGGACSVVVGFAPPLLGATAATVVVEHDARGGTLRVALRGAGTAANPAPPPPAVASAVLSPARMDFGSEAAGAPRVQQATLANRGNAPLAVRALTMTQPAAGFLARSACLHTSIAPGRTCTIQIAYTPLGAEPSSAELLVETDDPRGPVRLTLIGAGSGERAPVSTPDDGRGSAPAPRSRHVLKHIVTAVGAAVIGAAVVEVARSGGGGSRVGVRGSRSTSRAGSAPPTPSEARPGGSTADSAFTQCDRVIVTWSRVRSSTDSPVTYVVRFKSHGVLQALPTTADTATLPTLATLQWNVSARDATGNESPPSPWRYLRCPHL